MRCSVLSSMLILASCAGRPESGEAKGPAEPSAAAQCRVVDTSAQAEISSYEEGGITIHTYRAPAVSASAASHIVETADSLVVVDTQLLRDYARGFREYADGLGKPISHVIISHGHPDHYFGLEYFEDVTSYALPQTYEDIEQRQRFHVRMHREVERECEAVTDRVRMPTEVIEPGPLTVGGVDFELERVVSAEDDDQLVIRVPAAKTLILQDLMATDAHAFTVAGMIDRWIPTLERYAAMPEYTHVLVGHGRPGDVSSIGVMIEYLKKSQQIIDDSGSGEQFRDAMLREFPDRPGTYLVELMAAIKYDADG